MLRWRKLHRWTLSILILLSPELSFEQTTMVAVGPVGLAPRPSVFGRCFRRPRTRRGGRAVPFTVKVKQRNAARDAPDLQEDVEVMGVKDGVAVIAGSALGGGFLALPLVTAPLGILPSLVGLGMAWAFIAALCTVYAEVSAQTLTDKALEAVQSREDRPARRGVHRIGGPTQIGRLCSSGLLRGVSVSDAGSCHCSSREVWGVAGEFDGFALRWRLHSSQHLSGPLYLRDACETGGANKHHPDCPDGHWFCSLSGEFLHDHQLCGASRTHQQLTQGKLETAPSSCWHHNLGIANLLQFALLWPISSTGG